MAVSLVLFLLIFQFLARLGTRPSLEKIEPVLLGEGPFCKDVIELYGGEGTGKSETCLHFITRCILPSTWNGVSLNGCDAGVILIDNDYSFSILRLVTLMERFILHKAEETSKVISSEDVEKFIRACLRKLHVSQCSSSTEFVMTVHRLESLVCNEPGIAAIIIDSLSAFYWIDRYNGGDNIQAQEVNMKLAVDGLSKLVNTYSLVLIVTKAAVFKKKGNTNAVVDTVTDDLDAEHSEFLCKPWQRMVTNRLVFVLASDHSHQQAYIVGGDSMQEPKKFHVTESGLQFVS